MLQPALPFSRESQLHYSPNCDWASAHSSPHHLWSFPAGCPHFYLANHRAVSPGKTLATNTGCRRRRNNAGSLVFKELLSFQLPCQPFTAAVRFGREWRSRETWRLQPSAQSLPPLSAHPSALVWPLGFLRGKAPMDKLSVERHSIHEGHRGREEKRISDRDWRNKPSWST